MLNVNVKEGKNWLQVEECFEGKNQTSGNEYWCLKFQIIPKPRAGRQPGMLLGSFPVYFLKKFAWQLQDLQRIVEVCGVKEPWELYGKRFIADVTVNEKGYVRLRNPRPYAEEEPQHEPAGINAPGEWPW